MFRHVKVTEPDKDRISTVICLETGAWGRVQSNEEGTLYWHVESSLEVSTSEDD